MLKICLLLGLFLARPDMYAAGGNYLQRIAAKKEIAWLTVEEAMEKMEKEKRPILIDLYTDWCGWCKVMDKETYSNGKVIAYIEENFYPVKLNAETRKVISFRGGEFKYKPEYKVNEFAALLTQGNLSYPSTIILPADGTPPQTIPGYLKVPDMELVLRYFGDGHYGKTDFQAYHKSFKNTWN